MKINLFYAFFTLFAAGQVLADVRVFTNQDLVPASGIYEGKIDRVIFYSATDVGVFLKSNADIGIGLQFTGNNLAQGIALASAVGCDANIAKQKNGSYSFSVNSCTNK